MLKLCHLLSSFALISRDTTKIPSLIDQFCADFTIKLNPFHSKSELISRKNYHFLLCSDKFMTKLYHSSLRKRLQYCPDQINSKKSLENSLPRLLTILEHDDPWFVIEDFHHNKSFPLSPRGRLVAGGGASQPRWNMCKLNINYMLLCYGLSAVKVSGAGGGGHL